MLALPKIYASSSTPRNSSIKLNSTLLFNGKKIEKKADYLTDNQTKATDESRTHVVWSEVRNNTVIPQPHLIGVIGFEPINHETRIRCLPFWLNPSLQDRCLGTVPLYGGVEPLASNGSKKIYRLLYLSLIPATGVEPVKSRFWDVRVCLSTTQAYWIGMGRLELPVLSTQMIRASHLRYIPILIDCGGRIRTYDLLIMGQTSYQLLHPAFEPVITLTGADKHIFDRMLVYQYFNWKSFPPTFKVAVKTLNVWG